jgi:uncharacterized protein YunC (DUF1805 family)
MQEPIIKQCGAWIIALRELHGKLWRVDGTKTFDSDFAHGDEASEALTKFAEKVGLARHDVLRAFGL